VFIDLPETDRISVILAHLREFPVCGSLWLEMVDTNDGKELSNFCKKFEVHLRKALLNAGKLVDDPSKPRLLLTFKSGREVFMGLAESNNSAMWPMGIPRLKFPAMRPAAATGDPAAVSIMISSPCANRWADRAATWHNYSASA